MDKFEVGEVAIQVIEDTVEKKYSRYDGSEVEILKKAGVDFSSECIAGLFYYEVMASDGFKFYTAERTLRKKKPPKKEKTGTWSDGNNAWIPACLVTTTLEKIYE